jgi:hypothetical protein
MVLTKLADAYILGLGILGLIIIYPPTNLTSVDAYFFAVSASTESGLNPFVGPNLKTFRHFRTDRVAVSMSRQ